MIALVYICYGISAICITATTIFFIKETKIYKETKREHLKKQFKVVKRGK